MNWSLKPPYSHIIFNTNKYYTFNGISQYRNKYLFVFAFDTMANYSSSALHPSIHPASLFYLNNNPICSNNIFAFPFTLTFSSNEYLQSVCLVRYSTITQFNHTFLCNQLMHSKFLFTHQHQHQQYDDGSLLQMTLL